MTQRDRMTATLAAVMAVLMLAVGTRTEAASSGAQASPQVGKHKTLELGFQPIPLDTIGPYSDEYR